MINMPDLVFDDDVLVAAAHGEAEAWASIVDAVSPGVWKTITAAGVSGTEAENLAELVWLRTAQRLDSFADAAELRGCALTTASLESNRLVRQHAVALRAQRRLHPRTVVPLRPGFVPAQAGTPTT